MIDDRHPKLLEQDEDYVLMNDSLKGQRAMKDKNVAYLPPTSGMVSDGLFSNPTSTSGVMFNVRSLGFAAYSAYLERAVYPSFVQDAVDTLIGVMHREPAVIDLPPELEPMRKFATKRGESLAMLLQKINEAQLLKGRIGLLGDVAPGRPTPHIVEYAAENILNWDDTVPEFAVEKLHFLVLDETRVERGTEGQDLYTWRLVRRFRQCDLSGITELDGDGRQLDEAAQVPGVYSTFVEIDDNIGVNFPTPRVTPNFRGRTLSEIPFVFVGSTDLDTDPARIPLLPIANLALTVYRGEADYRQCLFMQGQDTLVVKNGVDQSPGDEEPEKAQQRRLGAGAVIEVGPDGDAKFIGVDSKGLPEMAKSLTTDYSRAREAGSRILEPRGSQAESGEALKIRVGTTVANLRKIAIVGAAGLEAMLKVCARWVGADESKVKVTPNLDFADVKRTPADALALQQAKKEGLPLSDRSVHQWCADNDLTTLLYDEEIAEMAKEAEEVSARMERLNPAPKQASVGQPGDRATEENQQ